MLGIRQSEKVLCHVCIFQLLLMIASSSLCAQQSSQAQSYEATIDKLMKASKYIARPNATGRPVNIDVSIHFVRLDEIKTIEQVRNLLEDQTNHNAETQHVNQGAAKICFDYQIKKSFTSDMFIRMRWNDTRLCHNESSYIIVPGEKAQAFWSPDLYFANALQSSKHDVMKNNNYIRIYPNGHVLTSIRVTVVARCIQDLTFYPVDSQKCHLVIESYSYPSKDVKPTWNKNSAVTIDQAKSAMPQFTIGSIETKTGEFLYSTGWFSRIAIEFTLHRHIGYYIIQVYLPCIFIVMLSWLTFWMNPEDIGSRTALSITSVLTIVLLLGSINENLPKVSYAKAIDYYLIGCFIHVFTVVIETVLAYHFFKKAQKKAQKKANSDRPAKKTSKKSWAGKVVKRGRKDACYEMNDVKTIDIEEDSPVKSETTKPKKGRKIVFKNIDSYCKVIFPLIFFLLNVSYWVYSVKNSLRKSFL